MEDKPDYTYKILSKGNFAPNEVNKILSDNQIWYDDIKNQLYTQTNKIKELIEKYERTLNIYNECPEKLFEYIESNKSKDLKNNYANGWHYCMKQTHKKTIKDLKSLLPKEKGSD